MNTNLDKLADDVVDLGAWGQWKTLSRPMRVCLKADMRRWRAEFQPPFVGGVQPSLEDRDFLVWKARRTKLEGMLQELALEELSKRLEDQLYTDWIDRYEDEGR